MLSLIKVNFDRGRKVLALLPVAHRRIVIILSLLCIFLLVVPKGEEALLRSLPLPSLSDANYVEVQLADSKIDDIPDYEWIVDDGDTLGEFFQLLNMSSTMTRILEADKNILSLDVINKGDKYRFWLSDEADTNGASVQLQRMEQVLGPEHQVVFVRKGEGFEYQEIILEGVWKQDKVVGEIKSGSNFSNSAVAQGLPVNDVAVVGRLLKTQVNFLRTAAGDKFQIILSRQYLDGVPTGNTKIEGVRFFNRRQVASAFSYKGNYFDGKGEGLERAFSRYPLRGNHRVSSSFNPNRKHPITGLVRPHNGTDFAVAKGTPVYSPGDGVVKRVVRHKYAGLYIEIQHSYQYRTRFLHLSKSYVKKGSQVKRGDKIALTGNSGRSTGAHLHYEFHVNQKPINAMGSKVPVAIGVDKKSMLAYKKRVSDLIKLMEKEDLSKLPVASLKSG